MCVRVFGLPKRITAFKLNKMFYDVHFYQRCFYNTCFGVVKMQYVVLFTVMLFVLSHWFYFSEEIIK